MKKPALLFSSQAFPKVHNGFVDVQDGTFQDGIQNPRIKFLKIFGNVSLKSVRYRSLQRNVECVLQCLVYLEHVLPPDDIAIDAPTHESQTVLLGVLNSSNGVEVAMALLAIIVPIGVLRDPLLDVTL